MVYIIKYYFVRYHKIIFATLKLLINLLFLIHILLLLSFINHLFIYSFIKISLFIKFNRRFLAFSIFTLHPLDLLFYKILLVLFWIYQILVLFLMIFLLCFNRYILFKANLKKQKYNSDFFLQIFINHNKFLIYLFHIILV